MIGVYCTLTSENIIRRRVILKIKKTKIRKDDDLNSCLEVNWELIRKTVCDILPLNYLLHFLK